jgi:hypothetical protein
MLHMWLWCQVFLQARRLLQASPTRQCLQDWRHPQLQLQMHHELQQNRQQQELQKQQQQLLC